MTVYRWKLDVAPQGRLTNLPHSLGRISPPWPRLPTALFDTSRVSLGFVLRHVHPNKRANLAANRAANIDSGKRQRLVPRVGPCGKYRIPQSFFLPTYAKQVEAHCEIEQEAT